MFEPLFSGPDRTVFTEKLKKRLGQDLYKVRKTLTVISDLDLNVEYSYNKRTR